MQNSNIEISVIIPVYNVENYIYESLSSVAKQKLYIMSYSKKIDRVIEDLDLNLPILHFNELTENSILNLETFNSVDDNKLEKMQEELKQAIKEERYEEAAKIRDEIKKMSN